MKERIIFHIDVNNAFLSWTAVYLLKNGYKKDIRKEPSIIGGDEKSRRGIVLAKSPIAKKYGVITAETIYSAKKKCPKLEIYPPNYQWYYEKSRELMEYLSKYSPNFEQFSIDECFLEMTGMNYIYDDLIKLANHIKNEIKERFGYTVNIGIGNNKLCAKMASDFLKPDKVHTLYDYEVKEKMYPLPIGDLFGVGKSTREKLQSLGIKTIGDLADFDITVLRRYFKNQAEYVINSARGINNEEVDSSTYIPKGISNELTISKDTNNYNELCVYLRRLSNLLARRVREQNKYANVIAVILKDKNFKRTTHQKKLKNPINTEEEIYSVSSKILKEMLGLEKIRLIGIRLDDLVIKKSYQTSLFEEENVDQNLEKLEKTIDKLKEKYGEDVIKKII